MARTVGVVFGLSVLFTSLQYCFDRAPFYIVRDIREQSTNVKRHKAKGRHSTYSINSILKRGLQNEHFKIAPYCRSPIECIKNREKCRQRNTKHEFELQQSKDHWLAVGANGNQGFSIHHEGTHHKSMSFKVKS